MRSKKAVDVAGDVNDMGLSVCLLLYLICKDKEVGLRIDHGDMSEYFTEKECSIFSFFFQP